MGFGKVNPKGKAGSLGTGTVPAWMTYNVLTYTPNNLLTYVTGKNPTGLYIGQNMTGTAGSNPPQRNIAIWTGLDSAATNTNWALTFGNSATDSVIIVPSTSASTSVLTSTVLIGSKAVCSGAGVVIGTGASSSSYSGPVVIGNSASVTGNNAVAIGTSSTSVAGGVAIGQTATAGSAGIAIGQSSTSGGSNFSIGGGNAGTGYGALCIGNGGVNNNTGGSVILTAAFSAIPTLPSTAHHSMALGTNSNTDSAGHIAFSNGVFASSTTGTATGGHYVLRTQTTSTTAVQMGATSGATNALVNTPAPVGYITMANNSTYMCTANIVAQVNGGAGDSAGWFLQFLVQRGASAATTAIVGTPTGTSAPAFATTGATTGAWAVTVTADTTNGGPAIKCSGQASTTINWVCFITLAKVGA